MSILLFQLRFLPLLPLLLPLLLALLLVPVAQTALAQQEARADGPAAGAAAATAAAPAASPAPVETVLQARNKVLLELNRKPVSLTMTIRSFSTARRLHGEVAFTISSEEPLEPSDELTCAPSLSLGCGVVARFANPGQKDEAPVVFEAQLDNGVFRIQDNRNPTGDAEAARNFETFVENLITHASVAVKVRVDQQQDFVFDLRRLPWPLAEFAADSPFMKRFGADPVLAGLKRRFPAQHLRIVKLARDIVPESGTLPPDAENRILEAMHAGIGSLRPMVPDELLEKIVMNADAAARMVGSRDLALCNALAVAARSALTTPELRDTPVAKEEYELWRQVVEQANPRFIRKVPNAELLPSTPRFEENVRQANASGCGMFAAVMEAILKLPRDERRLWLRATVGTVEDLRADTPPRRR
jgi:hypothetical protein